MRQATADWLRSAEMDLANIARIIDAPDLTPVAAFHSQQCVEKCFKATLEEHARRVPKDHSTLRLWGLVKDVLPIDADTTVLTALDALYIEARYPGEQGLLPHGKPGLAEARAFFDAARTIHDQVASRFSAGGRQ